MRFLAISGLMDHGRITQLSEVTNASFLAKPFTTEQIVSMLHSLLRAD
jgi:hypothetical protein